MFGGVDCSWMLVFGGPQDSREFILQQESAFNYLRIQTHNCVTLMLSNFWRHKSCKVNIPISGNKI
jgi:hypothetical protein